MNECQYCNESAKLVTGRVPYPHRKDLHNLYFWYCANGHEPAFVGCHKGTQEPLGILADAGLRKIKSAAHQAFDPIWKEGEFTRKQAYQWLADKLGIAVEDCHIGMFKAQTCMRVIEYSTQLTSSRHFHHRHPSECGAFSLRSTAPILGRLSENTLEVLSNFKRVLLEKTRRN